MFFSQSKANKELWEFCRTEYKNDSEFAYSKYTEDRVTILQKIKKSLKALVNKSLSLEAFSLRKAPF